MDAPLFNENEANFPETPSDWYMKFHHEVIDE
jgi:hypothetical protein